MVRHNLDFFLPQRCGAQWQAAYAVHVSLQIRRFQQAALLPKGYLNAVVGDDMYRIDGVKRDTSKLLRSLARNERTPPRVSILPRCVCRADWRTRRTSGRTGVCGAGHCAERLGKQKEPVYTLASVYTGLSTISLAIATVLFCFFHMYRTLADPKLLGGPADGGFIFHNEFPQLGSAVVYHIV